MDLHGPGPQLLKEFLAYDSNSFSSTGFRSFPRKPTAKNSPINLTRSRSKAAASTAISAIHRASEILFNAVKRFPFNSVKSASVLPRSISRRLKCQQKVGNDDVREVTVPVRVKDILRWKSFRDLVEEKPPPLDFSTSSSPTTASSNSSSWCDGSDFTAEDLPFWSGGNSNVGEKTLPSEGGVGGDSEVDPKGDLSCEEKEQHSPVSVLNCPFQDDEESFLSCHQSLSNLERRKHMLLQNIQHFESLVEQLSLDEKFSGCEEDYGDEYDEETNGIEEKARRLLRHVKASSSLETCEAGVDRLLLDFFSHELATSRNIQKDDKFDCEMLRVAKAWMSGQCKDSLEWGVEGKREAYVREMERGGGGRWSKFGEEQEELAMEVEVGVLDYLVDELFVDLSCSLKMKQGKR